MSDIFSPVPKKKSGRRAMSLIELMAAAGISLIFLVSLSNMNSLLLQSPLRAAEKFIAARMSRNFLIFAAEAQKENPEILLLLHWQESFTKNGFRPVISREKRQQGVWLVLSLWRGEELFHTSELLLPAGHVLNVSGGQG
jgi:hypothetical protein